MLEGSLPEHAVGYGGFWGYFFVALGLVLLVGSVWLVLSTDIGAKRGLLVVSTGFVGYLFLHALQWMLSAQAPRVAPEDNTYWGQHLVGMGIGAGALVFLTVVLFLSHRFERQAQRVED